MDRLRGKIAVVTGGAMGIGEATCRLFAQEGAAIVIADICKEEGRALEDELRADGFRAVFMKLDVTNEEDWKRVMEDTVSRFSKINVLVNNAGIVRVKNIEETTLADWNTVMDVNATGTFLGTRYAIEYMKQNGEPCSIIIRASVDGQVGEPDVFAYCASKGAVTLLAKSAAIHCGRMGYSIRVNSVHPGFIRTPMIEKEAAEHGQTPEEYCKKLVYKHPIGHVGKAIDVAYADLYLASDESLFVTGSELNVDGGATAI